MNRKNGQPIVSRTTRRLLGILVSLLAGPVLAQPAPAAGEATVASTTVPAFELPAMPAPQPWAEVNLDADTSRRLEDEWGVKVLGMRLGASEYMLDFRFRVLDAEKALPLFDQRIKPYIIADKSNIKLPVPMAAKVGAFRPTNRGKNITADRNYYIVFGNPDRHVNAGETVTVVIGDFRVDKLLVN